MVNQEISDILNRSLGVNNIVNDELTEDVSTEGTSDVVSMEDVRTACRIDGTDNDVILLPMKKAAEQYVLSVVGEEYRSDPRTQEAVLLYVQTTYRPEEDAQGNLKARITALMRQMQTSF